VRHRPRSVAGLSLIARSTAPNEGMAFRAQSPRRLPGWGTIATGGSMNGIMVPFADPLKTAGLQGEMPRVRDSRPLGAGMGSSATYEVAAG
jgi:hypothetical protein